MSALGDLGTFLKGERKGVTLELDNKLNAIAPYSGYLAVSKKLDNFYFQTSSSFIASMADKNRYVKFLDKVVDTYGPELVTNGDFSNGTAGWVLGTGWSVSNNTLIGSNVNGHTFYQSTVPISAGKTYLFSFSIGSYVSGQLEYYISGVGGWTPIAENSETVYNIVITPTLSNQNINFRGVAGGAFNGTIDNISVREIQSINLASYIPDVLVQDEATNGLTIQSSVNAGDMVVVNRIVQTGVELYRAKIDTPAGTSLTNTTYFEVRDSIGVTNQIGVFHKYNVLTNSYEGLSAEILFSDVSKEDLLDNPTWLARNGFSKAGEFCYSKGTYLYLPVSIWQTLNKGAYHPVFNGFGCSIYGNTTFGTFGRTKWYDSTVLPNNTVSLSFINKTQDSLGRDDGSVLGTADTLFPRPDSKYYDIVYPDQVIDIREYAKVLNKWEVDLIRADKEENGVEEVVFTEQVTQTTTGTVTTLEVGNGTNYKVGSVLQIWNGTTPYRRYVVSVSGNTVTLDSTIVKTAVPFIVGGGVKQVLSSNTKLSTDLIGNPTNYPQVMKDRFAEGKGIIGVNPLLVSDTGVNLIPDGTSKYFKLSDKRIVQHSTIYTRNSGGSYSIGYLKPVNIENGSTITEPTDIAVLEFYTSKNNPYIQTTPKAVVEVLPKVKASNSHSVYKGALVGNQVAGKVQVGNGANGYESKVLENAEIAYYEIIVCSKNNKTIDIVPYKTVLYADSLSASTAYWDVGHYYISKVYGIGNPYTLSGLTGLKTTPSDWIDYGTERPILHTTPTNSTIALDNANSPASKWFECLEEGNNGVLAGVYGQEVVYGADTGNFANLSNGTTTDFSNKSVRTFHGAIPLNGKIK